MNPNRTEIRSEIPGRLRIGISQLYHNHKLAKNLNRSFSEIEGISRLQVNIYTGSFLIHFHPEQISSKEIKTRVASFFFSPVTTGKREEISRSLSPEKEQVQKAEASCSKNISCEKNGWYLKDPEQLEFLFSTSLERGLEEREAQTRELEIGSNRLVVNTTTPLSTLIRRELSSGPVRILSCAGILAAIIGQAAEAAAITALLGVELFLGIWQKYRAESKLTALQEETADNTEVVRSGQITQIPAQKLVPGDVVLIRSGDIVPADMRLIQASDMYVDEAPLTGESRPVSKSDSIPNQGPLPRPERRNMLYMGTTVIRGSGRGLVVGTGLKTEMGSIADLLGDKKRPSTPLRREIQSIIRRISAGCLVAWAGVIAGGLLGGHSLLKAAKTGLSLAIGALPEGLTAVLTISLACGAQRMMKRGALVRDLPAIEGLSSVDVLCTDKTGTLTTGKMRITELYTLSRHLRVHMGRDKNRSTFSHHGRQVDPKQDPELFRLITIGALCNNCAAAGDNNGIPHSRRKKEDDPVESALWELTRSAGLDTEFFRGYNREREINFNSSDRQMAVICSDPQDRLALYLKGAPGVVLDQCTQIIDRHQIRTMTADDQEAVLDRVSRFTERGLRVLALAYKEFVDSEPKEESTWQEDLIFVGLVGMADPPRDGVRTALKKCRQAGIQPIMITGDHQNTAAAIGRETGLLEPGDRVITGDELTSLSEEELMASCNEIAIYARTSPAQKLRIVTALQKKGHVVAMTGDGINDSPAIKKADIGIAMGQNSAGITRQSSSIILTIDHFPAIIDVIAEGRTISSHLRCFLRYVLSGNVAQTASIIAAAVFGLPLMLMPIQILLINLITESLPAFALTAEPASEDLMKKPPKKIGQKFFDSELLQTVLNRGLIMALDTLAVFSGTLMLQGSLSRARTIAYANLVVTQLFHSFDCRDAPLSRQGYMWPAAIISAGMLIASIYIPGLRSIFKTAALQPTDWSVILFNSGIVGSLDQIGKAARKSELLIPHRTAREEPRALSPLA